MSLTYANKLVLKQMFLLILKLTIDIVWLIVLNTLINLLQIPQQNLVYLDAQLSPVYLDKSKTINV